jgi:pimeloyl-ACP methyl ester carboxylesterase
VIPEPHIVGDLAVREWGGDGTPFVFWHALGPLASGAELVEVAPRLVAHGYRVLSVDGPGFGASPHADDYSLAALAAKLDALELDRPVVMGHSWGGAVMVAYAATHPVRALVLADSGHLDYADLEASRNSPPPKQWEWESRDALDAWLRDGLDRVTPEVVAGYHAGARDENGVVMGASAEWMLEARNGLLERMSALWPALAGTPVLLFLATQEPHGSQNREHIGRFETAVPHADVRWVEGASHGLVADVGPELGDEIAEWLGRTLSA